MRLTKFGHWIVGNRPFKYFGFSNLDLNFKNQDCYISSTSIALCCNSEEELEEIKRCMDRVGIYIFDVFSGSNYKVHAYWINPKEDNINLLPLGRHYNIKFGYEKSKLFRLISELSLRDYKTSWKLEEDGQYIIK